MLGLPNNDNEFTHTHTQVGKIGLLISDI
jgi:hypothetical protein